MAAAYGFRTGRNKVTSADHAAIGPGITRPDAVAASASLVRPDGQADRAGGGRRNFLRVVCGLLAVPIGAAGDVRIATARAAPGPVQGPGDQFNSASRVAADQPGSAPAQPAPGTGRSAPARLLILGDSLSAGYGLAHRDGFQPRLQAGLKARGFDVDMVDAAVSGDTSAGGRARLDWALGDGADAAIVELGGNDGLRGLDPRDMQANLSAILDTLATRRIPVLLTGMYAPPNLGPDYGRAFRAVFDALGKRPGVIYDPFFLDGVATINDLNQGDGIHPNPEGVRRIVARLLPLVEKLLAEIHPA